MYTNFRDFLKKELADIEAAGLYKKERVITTPQRADIKVNAGEEVLNFCANNYLGLSDNTRLIEAAKKAMDTHGYGMSSVRFICGTQDLHKQLEAAISDYFHTEDTILYAACFDANGGLFEPLFTEEDAIISDALNHASIIDGVDALCFTGGIGENSSLIREIVCAGLDGMGLIIDPTKNNKRKSVARDIATNSSTARIFVIPTNEEFVIANDTYKIVSGLEK
jgi:hypothetical protein